MRRSGVSAYAREDTVVPNIDGRPLDVILADKQQAEAESQAIPTESEAQKQRRERAEIRAYTIRQFCEAYSVSRSRLYLMIGDGTIEARKSGKRTIITAAEAERWLNSLPKMEASHAA
jgi:hypothetical protein